jgi:hypothetical protein
MNALVDVVEVRQSHRPVASSEANESPVRTDVTCGQLRHAHRPRSAALVCPDREACRREPQHAVVGAHEAMSCGWDLAEVGVLTELHKLQPCLRTASEHQLFAAGHSYDVRGQPNPGADICAIEDHEQSPVGTVAQHDNVLAKEERIDIAEEGVAPVMKDVSAELAYAPGSVACDDEVALPVFVNVEDSGFANILSDDACAKDGVDAGELAIACADDELLTLGHPLERRGVRNRRTQHGF